MELKDYQKKAINRLRLYLTNLSEWQAKNEAVTDPDLKFDFTQKAWEKTTGFSSYAQKKNGLGKPIADFYIKIPTGGGKTLLACHSIDLVNKIYLKKSAGLVLWIVPTNQIYRQTYAALKDRDHPYRQVLDISSGGRTIITQKGERFTPQDIMENLVVLLLMLPSANREDKETLRLFKDSGGFEQFFPKEDDVEANRKLLKQIPNLDCFGQQGGIWGKVPKTSMGNTLRMLQPMVIVDEGHKAFGELSQNTILGFNPSIIIELSATPPKGTNHLVQISGKELDQEGMIKLDLHVINKPTSDWKGALNTSVEKRAELEQQARQYRRQSGEYIRPILLVQAERTGKEQRGSHFIHSEDVKEHLMGKLGIPEDQIAIKSSEKDDIEGIDLLSDDCSIRFIITKQALQEGWDCPFAYVLAVLTNPSSQLSITQLVGRILRQPRARKTRVKALDESYVFCFRSRADDILNQVREGFDDEGLGDLSGRVLKGDSEGKTGEVEVVHYRPDFRKFEGRIYLPKFVIREEKSWRDVNYDRDILSRVDWEQIKLEPVGQLSLGKARSPVQEITIGLTHMNELKDAQPTLGIQVKSNEPDASFLAHQLSDIIPNPWVAYAISFKALLLLQKKYSKEIVAANLSFIAEELGKIIEPQRDQLAQIVFRELLEKKTLHFFLLSRDGSYELPRTIQILKDAKKLVRSDNSPIQRGLFEYIDQEDLNEMERSIAIYLDEQERLLWWYRNLVKGNAYFIQAWKKGRIFPDFVFSEKDAAKKVDYNKVYVVESKGQHLVGNADTIYKQDVFELCNSLGHQIDWEKLSAEFRNKRVEFQVIQEQDWKKRINEIFE